MDKTIKYIGIRISQLQEELAKNSTNSNDLIIEKSIAELEVVLNLLKREKLLQINPYADA